MKPRTLLILVVVAGLTVGGIWLFNKPAAAEPQKTAEAPKLAEAPKPATFAPTPKVAAPTLTPATKPMASTTPALAPINSSGAPAELTASIDDMTNMLQSGNLVGMFENYAPPEVQAQLTPEMKAQMEQQIQMMMSDPRGQQQIQMMVGMLQSLKGQAPTLNDAGDKAVYQVTPPPEMMGGGANMPATIPITFTKQNGKWYIADGPGGM